MADAFIINRYNVNLFLFIFFRKTLTIIIYTFFFNKNKGIKMYKKWLFFFINGPGYLF